MLPCRRFSLAACWTRCASVFVTCITAYAPSRPMSTGFARSCGITVCAIRAAWVRSRLRPSCPGSQASGMLRCRRRVVVPPSPAMSPHMAPGVKPAQLPTQRASGTDIGSQKRRCTAPSVCDVGGGCTCGPTAAAGASVRCQHRLAAHFGFDRVGDEALLVGAVMQLLVHLVARRLGAAEGHLGPQRHR